MPAGIQPHYQIRLIFIHITQNQFINMTIQTINAAQLQQWQQQKKDFILLDVREDNEVQYAAIAGYLHIPMNMIPLRQNELPDNKPIVIYCHHGMRSMQVALYLQDTGFENLYNLKGGIDAWSREVDNNIPTY